MIYPANFESKIKFDKIRQHINANCLSDMGRQLVDSISFSHEQETIRQEQEETAEFIRICQEEDNFPVSYYQDARPFLNRIKIEGLFLEVTELVILKNSLESLYSIVRFFNGKEERFPRLTERAGAIRTFPFVLQRLESIVSKHGTVKDSASPALGEIRRSIASKQSGISRRMQALLQKAQQEGWADKDTNVSVRDGRMVIPVPSAHKRKLNGIVHDESATGKTSYIEPTEIIETNNEIRELQLEEKREITRILRKFADELRPYVNDLVPAYDFMAFVDFTRAKALFALRINGVVPKFEDTPSMSWRRAKHPLLYLSLKKNGKEAVPMDMELNDDQRIILISGPNAGGKSVCLKTVAIIQYMMQCGLPAPIGENSRTGIFDSLFIDIGDEQSIEDDLSTYSSHLLNMKNMIRFCKDTSLLLIDEFGGGTEPQIGGAIAEAVLKRFNQKKAFGIITTHYQNLKHFAEDHEGVINGAMLYDRQHMQALYQLQIGNPGSSFAVEIARKIGLPEDVIADASELVGKEYINADKYLQDIVRDKRYWENKRQNIHQREKEMEKVIAQYEAQIEALQRERKDILQQAKEDAEQLLKASNAKIEQTIKAIRETQAEKENTRTVRKELTAFKDNLKDADSKYDNDRIARKIQQLQERKKRQAERKAQKASDSALRKEQARQQMTQAMREAEEQSRPLQAGETVRIKGQTAVGTIEETDGRNAIVTFGMMRTNIKTERLERADPPSKKEETRAATYLSKETQDAVYEKKLNFRQDIDVRGMRGDEALTTVTYFIDDAILLGIPRVRILHGTGSGILRTLIRQYLHTVAGVKDVRDEHVQFGGAGITVVDLA